MNVAEILRKLADTIDGNQEQPSSTEITNRPDQSEVEVSHNANDVEARAQVNVKPMVTPLQLQAEILKKITGQPTDNESDCCPHCGCDPCSCETEQEQPEDAVMVIKRNAGLQ